MRKKIQNAVRSDKIKFFLFGVIVAMAVILVSMIIIRLEEKDRMAAKSRVSLGAMQYDFSNGQAVKRTDESVTSLKNFLEAESKKTSSDDCTVNYAVMSASSDEKQVLLGYGCSYPSARMFAVNDNGVWKTISPTNHFDMLGVPECSYVNENKISKDIAPVCVNELQGDAGTTLTYSVR